MELTDFHRNTSFDERYDENSFIGILLDYLKWDDEEYWKLDANLQQILKLNSNKKFISQEIMEGIFSICNDIFLTGSWSDIKIHKGNSVKKCKLNIYDRFRRLKTLLVSAAYGDKSFFKIDFVYKNS